MRGADRGERAARKIEKKHPFSGEMREKVPVFYHFSAILSRNLLAYYRTKCERMQAYERHQEKYTRPQNDAFPRENRFKAEPGGKVWQKVCTLTYIKNRSKRYDACSDGMAPRTGFEPAAFRLGVRRCHSVFFSTSSTVSSRFISCCTADTPNRKLSL